MYSKTEIICVLDRSGSMASMAEEAIGGFNAFLEEQKKIDGEADMTVCLFDNEYMLLHNGLPLEKVQPLDDQTFVPRGTTALFDAIGRTVDMVRFRHEKLPPHQRPQKVIMAILTDGLENASSDYTKEKVRQILEEVQEGNWEVFYLAANQDAFAVGMGMGVAAANSMNYNSNAKGGTRAVYEIMSSNISRSRTQ